jgi:hypothetical protein
MRHRFAACVLLCGSLAAGACSSDVTTAPTTTTPTTINESFSGTLTRNGAATYPFSTGAGSVAATVTTLSPTSTLLVGFSLGTWTGTACQNVLVNDSATQGTVIVGSASAAGNLCVRIYDSGSVTQPSSYQIDVVHP